MHFTLYNQDKISGIICLMLFIRYFTLISRPTLSNYYKTKLSVLFLNPEPELDVTIRCIYFEQVNCCI